MPPVVAKAFVCSDSTAQGKLMHCPGAKLMVGGEHGDPQLGSV